MHKFVEVRRIWNIQAVLTILLLASCIQDAAYVLAEDRGYDEIVEVFRAAREKKRRDRGPKVPEEAFPKIRQADLSGSEEAMLAVLGFAQATAVLQIANDEEWPGSFWGAACHTAMP